MSSVSKVSCDHLPFGRGLIPRNRLGRALDGSLYPVIGHAAAERTGHSLANLSIRGMGIFIQQHFGGQDLPVLTETALRNLFIDPGLLDRMKLAVPGESFERGDLALH